MESEEREHQPEQRLADQLWEKILKDNPKKCTSEYGPAMDFGKRHTQFPPTLILDEDNGVDFTFKGMGLKGNRLSKDQ